MRRSKRGAPDGDVDVLDEDRTRELREPATRPRVAWQGAHGQTVIAVAVMVVSTVVAWVRLPSTARGAAWAEDAGVFLYEAVNDGAVTSVFRPYAGYLHVVPRLVTAVVTEVSSVSDFALGLALGSCVVAGAVAALVFVCTRDLIAWWPARVGLALITVVAPVLPQEVLGNVTNLHWFVVWLTPWLLLVRPRSTRGAWGLAVVGLLAALTEPQMALFTPLMLIERRDRSRWPVRGAVLIGLAIQALVALTHPRGLSGSSLPSLWSVLEGWLFSGVLRIWVRSDEAAASLVVGHGWVVAVLALVPFLALLGAVLRRGSRAERLLAVALLVASIGAWAFPSVVNLGGGSDYSDYARWSGTDLTTALTTDTVAVLAAHRYGVASSMFLLGLVPLAAAVARRERWGRLWAPAVLIAAGVVVSFSFIPAATDRDGAPSWSQEVQDAQAACVGAESDDVRMWAVWPQGWFGLYTCAQLSELR